MMAIPTSTGMAASNPCPNRFLLRFPRLCTPCRTAGSWCSTKIKTRGAQTRTAHRGKSSDSASDTDPQLAAERAGESRSRPGLPFRSVLSQSSGIQEGRSNRAHGPDPSGAKPTASVERKSSPRESHAHRGSLSVRARETASDRHAARGARWWDQHVTASCPRLV